MHEARRPLAYQHRAWALTHDLIDALTIIKTRAQLTRRRIERVQRLSRAHVAADLDQIAGRVDRAVAIMPGHDESSSAPGG